MGVISFYLMSGYFPFGQDPEQIKQGKFQFEESEWKDISPDAKSFIRILLSVDPKKRPIANEALKHPWMTEIREEKPISIGFDMI